MLTIEDYLIQNAEKYPDKIAVICGNEHCSYASLFHKVKQRCEELRQQALQPLDIVPFIASQTIDFLVTYFAIHLVGGVCCPLEKDIPANKFEEIKKIMQNGVVPNDTADILYTTGTTGKSKGVIISHKTIIADAENLIEGQGFCHNLHFIITGPLNHIGSLSKIYPNIILGATIHILEGMKDLNAFFEAIEKSSEKVATFMVPSAIRMLLKFNAQKLASYKDKIDFIETGAAPMAISDMQLLCNLLPKTRLYNTYASTETGIIATYNYNDGKCIAGCLGKPMKHAQIIITKDGLISCKGKTLMSGYLNDEELSATVLKDNTVYTKDIGYLDCEGRLHLQGREDDVINVGGYKVAPTEVENVALAMEDIKDCICIAIPNDLTGFALKLLIVLNDNTIMDKQKIARYLRMNLESYKVPFFYEQVDKIQRTYNGKIDRKFYNNQ